MLNLNKKGFFMTETLMVIVFVASIFTFIYISIIPLVGKYNDKTKRESDIDIVYKLFSIRKAINKDIRKTTIINNDVKQITCNDFGNKDYCNELMSELELSRYILVYTKNISNNYDTIKEIDKEIEKYLEQYKNENESALILLDKTKHTIVHLNYVDPDMNLGDLLEYKAEKKKCSPLFTDTDGIKYFSGTNECVDFNYVWYSGKLWRITAIYPDGAMKLVTQNNITTIAFNENGKVNFYAGENDKSYMYQWLNEDFYDTLYNASEIIDTTKKWNGNLTSNIEDMPVEANLISANVGLLNSHEYYNAYRKSTSSNNYLNIGYYWWLLNKSSDSNIWIVNENGNTSNMDLPFGLDGVRPSINVKSSIKYTGNGTIENPYRLIGDKIRGQSNDYVNTRISGEYIKLKNSTNEQLFRIIEINDNKTKIIAMEYADNGSAKPFSTNSSSSTWGQGSTTDSGTWYTYLNDPETGYLKILKNTYGNLFDSGIYYLGKTPNHNYKLGVCSIATNENIKDCEKTTNKIFDVAIPRYGEMFATQQSIGQNNLHDMWLINGYAYPYLINSHCTTLPYWVSTGAPDKSFSVRPTLHLKSTVKIKSGKGTYDDPYVVGL